MFTSASLAWSAWFYAPGLKNIWKKAQRIFRIWTNPSQAMAQISIWSLNFQRINWEAKNKCDYKNNYIILGWKMTTIGFQFPTRISCTFQVKKDWFTRTKWDQLIHPSRLIHKPEIIPRSTQSRLLTGYWNCLSCNRIDKNKANFVHRYTP